jgi:hypothetical protein
MVFGLVEARRRVEASEIMRNSNRFEIYNHHGETTA